MSHIIKCPHCGKPAVSLAFIRDKAEHKAHVRAMKTAAADDETLAKAVLVDEVCWSTRVQNVFSNGIDTRRRQPDGSYVTVHARTLGDLCSFTEGELRRTPNLGRVSVDEIKATLQEFGLSLRNWRVDAA